MELWVYDIAYSTYSAMSGNASTQQEAQQKCADMVNYYTDMGYVIRHKEVYRLCDACEGSGRVIAKRHKRGFPKFKPCAACKETGRHNDVDLPFDTETIAYNQQR